MRIHIDTDSNAPGCPCRIVADDGRDILVQTDLDYPSFAQVFGWELASVQRRSAYCCDGEDHCGDIECAECNAAAANALKPPCKHYGTDGTVTCSDCGVTAGEFISAAGEFLRDNDGAEADDPGYFYEA